MIISPAGGPGTGFSFALKDGRIGLNTFGGGSIYHSPTGEYSNTRTTYDDPSSLIQQGSRASNGKSGYLGTEISFEKDSLQLLFATFNISGNRSTGSVSQHMVVKRQPGLFSYNRANRYREHHTRYIHLPYHWGNHVPIEKRLAAYRQHEYHW